MKIVSILLSLFIGFALALPAGAENEMTSSVLAQKLYTLTPAEFKTLEIFDMDGNPVKDFRTQNTMNADRDEFLGLYVKVSSRIMYYVVRPIGGKPIKSISWKEEPFGGVHSLLLNGKTVSEYFRDEQNLQRVWTSQESIPMIAKEIRNLPVTSPTIYMVPLDKADANSLYAKWFDKEGVSATYISPAMFKIIRKIPQIELDRPVDLTPIVQTLDGLYMLDFAEVWSSRRVLRSSRLEYAASGLRKDIQDYLSAKGYEKLMEKREGEMITRLYVATNGKTVSGFVLTRMDLVCNYGQFVCIEGKIPRDKFEELIANGMK